METTKPQQVLVSTELAAGLLEVLEETRGKRAKTYAKLLQNVLAKDRGKAAIPLPMSTIASILRILLMVFLPDSTVHTILMTLERL
jgi:hypothetical protein